MDRWWHIDEKVEELGRSYGDISRSCKGLDGETVEISYNVRSLNRGKRGGSDCNKVWIVIEPSCPHYSSGGDDTGFGQRCGSYGSCSNLSEYYANRQGEASCRHASVYGDYDIFDDDHIDHISGVAGNYPDNQEDD